MSNLSNAPEGFPAVSPEGYPYFYPLGGDGQPVGHPRLVFDNQTFESVSEINTYKKMMARRGEERFMVPDAEGAVSPADAKPGDLAYLWYKRLEYQGEFFRAVFRAPAVEISRLMQAAQILNPGSEPREPEQEAFRVLAEGLIEAQKNQRPNA